MKRIISRVAFVLFLAAGAVSATTINVMPVHEPLSLHGTDGDEVISDIGEALQACVMARPMALTGAFPEVLVSAIRSPHLFPTNNRNYQVQEVNLLVLCKVGITAEKTKDEEKEGLLVKLDVSDMAVPPQVDLTKKQILKLAIVAVRRTVEEYQKQQTGPLEISLLIDGAGEKDAPLRELDAKFTVPGSETNG